METLTGKHRHRAERRWGRERLILQVEVQTLEMDNDPYGYAERVERWRDATTADLTTRDRLTPAEHITEVGMEV